MDAHEREARGAAAGMAEIYGADLPAVGDYVRGITYGRRWAGRVIAAGDRMLTVDVDGATLEVFATDLVR